MTAEGSTTSFLCHSRLRFRTQVSCYFQAQTQRSTLANNICFNGPRAGINFNDGMGGGNLLEGMDLAEDQASLDVTLDVEADDSELTSAQRRVRPSTSSDTTCAGQPCWFAGLPSSGR